MRIMCCVAIGLLLSGCVARNYCDLAQSFKWGSCPPPAAREFRAAWVATVGNIDWPSKPGLQVDEQRREIFAILDRAQSLKLNAIILQVRTSCDAL